MHDFFCPDVNQEHDMTDRVHCTGNSQRFMKDSSHPNFLGVWRQHVAMDN